MPITTISAKHSGPITMSRQRNTAISCRTLKGSARVSIPAFRFLHGLPMCNTEYNANVPFASAAFDTCDRESPLHPHSLSAATRLFLPFLLRYRRFFPPTPMHAYLYRPAVHAGSFHCLSLQAVNHRAAHNRCLANILADTLRCCKHLYLHWKINTEGFFPVPHFFQIQVSIFFFLCGILYSGNFIIFTPSRYPECQRHFAFSACTRIFMFPSHGISDSICTFTVFPFTVFPHCFPYTNAQTAYPHFL